MLSLRKYLIPQKKIKMGNETAEPLDKYVDILNTHGYINVSKEEKQFLEEHAANAKLIRLCKTARAMKALYATMPC